ncbi:hypothetical protein [Xanthomonas campestris]|uniref:hypothetical protein n=1 Tax=Xanthomonas campestris TaxID=339 RepID=UPI001D13CA87|nr:hypothetical protein [Xanthomonas campestris]MCC3253730.1 hypothetical protein [Xanthomonas campestris pv. armoraciae]
MERTSIPVITADLITATALIGSLRTSGLRERCQVVQSIVATGKAVDELTVGELVALSKQVHSHGQ